MLKGTLIVQTSKNKTIYRLKYTTAKGKEAITNIREMAICFSPKDAKDGAEAEYELGPDGQPSKVVLVGFAEVQPRGAQAGNSSRPQQSGRHQNRGGRNDRQGYGQGGPRSLKTVEKAPASALQLPFHNPYTFIPFATPKRQTPSLRTGDELGGRNAADRRYSGVIFLKVTTKRPLMTLHPEPAQKIETKDTTHMKYKALRIAEDVIVPSTGVRGALRTLLTVISGGTLGYIDQQAILCQARDLALAVANYPEPGVKDGVCVLAKVIEPGNAARAGKIKVGSTELISLADLEQQYRGRLDRSGRGQKIFVGLGERGPKVSRLIKVSTQKSEETPYEVKLSGRPVNLKNKREGAFLDNGETIELAPSKWADFYERYKHGPHHELKRGDLVWIEVKDPSGVVHDGADVISLQAARWGRRGERLLEAIDKHAPQVIPDYLRDDGLVDEVTNLFGQVNVDGVDRVNAFQSKVRADNLVFEDGAKKLREETLAPLAPPHPGCVAFYRHNTDPDAISHEDPLRGFKVYRVGQEGDQPWTYQSQPITEVDGRPKNPMQSVNKTAELLEAGCIGHCQLAFRSLSKRELAMLMLACTVPWRLGGGKSLGLGLCEVAVEKVVDEFGQALAVDEWQASENDAQGVPFNGWEGDVQDLLQRAKIWKATQQPVPLMRYPRAAEKNRNKINRGGHVWFPRHAAPNQTKKAGEVPRGLRSLRVTGALKAQVKAPDPGNPLVQAQPLPLFDADRPLEDLLFGFDGFSERDGGGGGGGANVLDSLPPFDPDQHVTGTERSGGNHSENAATRKQRKIDRDW